MKKRTLIFDVDDVIVPDRWLPWLNRYLETNGKPTYPSHDVFKTFFFTGNEVFKDNEKEMNDFLKFFLSHDSYKGMKPIEGAIEGIKQLNENNDVFLATSCLPQINPRAFIREYADKMNWLMDNLPFFPTENIVAINKKHILHGHSMTDDKLSNLKGNFDKKIMYSAWHNKDITNEELKSAGAIRANNWNDILEILK